MRVNYGAFDKVYRRLRAEGSDWNTPEQLGETVSLISKFFDRAEVPRSGRVLELGCGAGDLSLWLAGQGFEVFGVDISPTAINWAREKFSARRLSGNFRVASVLDLAEFDEGFFDIVLDGHCFHCIIGDDRRLFLSNVYRVLRPRGIFHVATMCGEIHDPEVRAAFDPVTRCIMRDGMAIRQIETDVHILHEIESAGFRILHWEIDPPTTLQDQGDILVNATR
ncbi:MAG: methyltransferase domain-containing protein [Terriglobia bacterium]